MAVAYILIFIVCIILILVILVQNSKGGGLAANFTGSQVMGVRKTADFLEKATWTLAGTLLLFCIVANMLIPHQKEDVKKSVLQDEIKNAIDPTATPKLPSAPAQGVPAPEKK
jgi:preprotein translocase subunit SecG